MVLSDCFSSLFPPLFRKPSAGASPDISLVPLKVSSCWNLECNRCFINKVEGKSCGNLRGWTGRSGDKPEQMGNCMYLQRRPTFIRGGGACTIHKENDGAVGLEITLPPLGGRCEPSSMRPRITLAANFPCVAFQTDCARSFSSTCSLRSPSPQELVSMYTVNSSMKKMGWKYNVHSRVRFP